MPGEGPIEAGRVVALDKEGAVFGVSTGDGVLAILSVELKRGLLSESGRETSPLFDKNYPLPLPREGGGDRVIKNLRIL